MRAVRAKDGEAVVTRVDEPVDGAEGSVVVEVKSASICGSDFSYLKLGVPVTLGHEFAGIVDGVPYAVEPMVWCGVCEQCRAGHTQRCVEGPNSIGFNLDGGLADYVRVPAETLVALPEGVGVEDASLIETASVVVARRPYRRHPARRARRGGRRRPHRAPRGGGGAVARPRGRARGPPPAPGARRGSASARPARRASTTS